MNNQGRFYSNEEIRQILMINGMTEELESFLSNAPRRVKEYIEDVLIEYNSTNIDSNGGEKVDEGPA